MKSFSALPTLCEEKKTTVTHGLPSKSINNEDLWFLKTNNRVAGDLSSRDAHVDGLVQERRNSIAKALELRLPCTNPSIWCYCHCHYNDVIMSAMASQITSLTFVYSAVYSGADQRKYQSSASLAFVRGIHRWPVNSPYKGPVTRKIIPFDDVIMAIPYPLLPVGLRFLYSIS